MGVVVSLRTLCFRPGGHKGRARVQAWRRAQVVHTHKKNSNSLDAWSYVKGCAVRRGGVAAPPSRETTEAAAEAGNHRSIGGGGGGGGTKGAEFRISTNAHGHGETSKDELCLEGGRSVCGGSWSVAAAPRASSLCARARGVAASLAVLGARARRNTKRGQGHKSRSNSKGDCFLGKGRRLWVPLRL